MIGDVSRANIEPGRPQCLSARQTVAAVGGRHLERRPIVECTPPAIAGAVGAVALAFREGEAPRT